MYLSSPADQKLLCCENQRSQSELCGRTSPHCAGFSCSVVSQLTEAVVFFNGTDLNVTERQKAFKPKKKRKKLNIFRRR